MCKSDLRPMDEISVLSVFNIKKAAIILTNFKYVYVNSELLGRRLQGNFLQK